MSRRIEIELTSKVDDASWTWRAAGARQPKGTLDAKLLPDNSKVGDVLRADVENDIDGIAVLAVLAAKEKPAETNRIELIPRLDRPPATPTAPPRRDARSAKPERDKPRREPRERAERPDRPSKPRGERPERSRADKRPARPTRATAREAPPERPKPKRLSPGHTHRNALLDTLPPEQRPIAEQVVKGGIPAVRQAIDTQNALLKADKQPVIKADPLLALAEELLPRVKSAEWRDRADAAIAAGDDVSLRDLRSIVSSADAARDDEARLLARSLRDALDARLKLERDTWVKDIGDALDAGRVVRGLRIASRPPDPAMRFPSDLGARLADAASTAMAPDAPPDRWLAVLDAVAVSPVRRSVEPRGLPPEPDASFLDTLRQTAARVPAIGPLVGIAPGQVPPPPRPLPRRRPPPGAAAPASPPPPNGGSEQTSQSAEESVTAADT
jgi:hypothetical protein